MMMKKSELSNIPSRHAREGGSPAALSFRRLAIAIGSSLVVLGLLGWAVGGAVDQLLHRLIHLQADSATLRWVLDLTDLGGAAVMIPVALLALAWLLIRRDFAAALWLFSTVAVGRIIVELAKLGFARPRPPTADRLADVTSLSFPSSHATGAMMTGVALCLAFRAGRSAWVAALTFALAIGVTRVVLGVHWPSDVIAGWGFGLAWPFFCARWLPPDRRTG
jgi:membrane-associated phospholipid phosphatase